MTPRKRPRAKERKRITDLKERLGANEVTFGPDGPGSGALRVYCEEQAVQLQQAWNLPGEENRVRVLEYLYGCCGEIAHAFPGHVDLPGYHEWLELSRSQLIGG